MSAYEVKKVIRYLKDNKNVASVLGKHCDFDLKAMIDSDYETLPSHKKRELKEKLADFGLISREQLDIEKQNNQRVDDIESNYYNYDFKMHYLDNHSGYKEETKRVLRVFFRKISDIEYELNKDFYDFTSIEVERALKSIGSKTVRSLQNITAMLSKYVDYAIGVNKAIRKENVVNSFSMQEKAIKLVDTEKSERLYFERDEVMDMAMQSINAQDGVILALLHDGFSHKYNFTELVNLKVADIDWDLEIAVIPTRKKSNREVKLSKETMFLLKEAISNEFYLSTKEDSDITRSYEVPTTDYVLRGLRAKNSDSKLSWRNLNQRIIRISEYFGNEMLNATNIVSSSQIDTAYNLFMEDKTIGDRAIEKALLKFDFPYNKSALFALKKKVAMYKKTHIV